MINPFYEYQGMQGMLGNNKQGGQSNFYNQQYNMLIQQSQAFRGSNKNKKEISLTERLTNCHIKKQKEEREKVLLIMQRIWVSENWMKYEIPKEKTEIKRAWWKFWRNREGGE